MVVVSIAALAGWLSVAFVLARLHRGLKGTALTLAGHWCLAVWLTWAIVKGSTALGTPGAGLAAALWYVFAVTLLAPPIAVLGARRPICRVWNWFVLIPLMLVFVWPVLTIVWGKRAPAAWNLEAPVCVGYAFVLLMGIGNYLGTRMTVPALLWAAAAVSIVAPLTPAWASQIPYAREPGDVALLLLSGAAWLGLWLARQKTFKETPTTCPLNHAWSDFQELFGVVWSHRVRERFNEMARASHPAVRLERQGIEAQRTPAGAPAQPAEMAAANASLRWLLQKFVDADWIDRRIEPPV
ncbi:MAG: hypothetical protein ACT4QC_04695 [Planctomycetaceae bacterium]